jgi:nicotinamidase-related amidase
MAPKRNPVALLLIDVINDFNFEGCEGLVRAAERASHPIAELKRRAHEAGVPVIYVNDNFGRWRSDFRHTVEACADPKSAGHAVTNRLRPTENDYFVLKPRHSGFYCTALELLLDQLGSEILVLVGFATNICVLFTANDARMRGYRVLVPKDCAASNSEELTAAALAHLQTVNEADTRASTEIDFAWLAEHSNGRRDVSHPG